MIYGEAFSVIFTPEDCGKFNEKMNIEHRILNGKDEQTEIANQGLTSDI